MWTCIKCHAVNEDLYTICPKCGASRSAGRFGSVPQPTTRSAASPDKITDSASAAPSLTAQAPASPPAAPAVYYEPDLSKIKTGRFVRYLGILLTVFLPLLTILYFIAQYNRQLFVSLSLAFFQDVNALPSFIPVVLYIFTGLLAALLSALPGVWTLCIGRILKPLARMEELL